MQQKFNRYNLIMEIARKSLSTVYFAHDESDPEHTIILNVFDPACFFSQDERDSFLLEVEALKRLRHPHIVPVMDAGMNDDGQGFIVSDYLPTGSLHARQDSLSPQRLPFRTAIHIILQVGKALTYAHNQAIVHGAVAPDTIYLDANGAALIANFSLASVAENVEADQEDNTDIAYYRAPEQLDGKPGKQCDQYALGCIAYELLTGCRPFPDGVVASAQPVAPTSIVSTLPESLDEAILKALASEPSQRHADISSFLQFFQTVVQPHPPEFPLPRSMRKTAHQTEGDFRATSGEHHSSAQEAQSASSITEQIPPIPLPSAPQEIEAQSAPTLVAHEEDEDLPTVPRITDKLRPRSATTDPISDEQSVEALVALLRISQMEQEKPEPSSLAVPTPTLRSKEVAPSSSLQNMSNQSHKDRVSIPAIDKVRIPAKERSEVRVSQAQPHVQAWPHSRLRFQKRMIFRGGGIIVFAVIGALVSYILSPLDIPLQTSLAHRAASPQPVAIVQNQPTILQPAMIVTPTTSVPKSPSATPKSSSSHHTPPPKAQSTPVVQVPPASQASSVAQVPPIYQVPTPTPTPVATTPKTTGQGTTSSKGSSTSTNTQTSSPAPTAVPATTSGNSSFSGYYYIANRFSGLVLDDTNWSTSDGTIIQQWSEVSGQSDQEWSLRES